MADLVAADVTYTRRRILDRDGMKEWYGTVAFGDGTDTYPTGGVPAAKGKFGFARTLESFQVTESNGNGLVYEYDRSAETIRIFEVDTTGDTDKALVELDGGSDTPAAATLEVVAVGI